MPSISRRTAMAASAAIAVLILGTVWLVTAVRHPDGLPDNSSPATIAASPSASSAGPEPFDYARAVRTIERQGNYVPPGPPPDDPGPFRVIIAACGRDTAHCFFAAFFYGNQFVGMDSGQDLVVSVHATDGNTIELSYPQFTDSDPLGGPSGRDRLVRWRYENGRLTADIPLPADPNDRALNRLDNPLS